jgi:hypothetical protein
VITMQSLVHLIKVNDVRSGEKNGRKWQMQDAEAILLTPEGKPDQVGVLMIPRDKLGAVNAGVYTATFALKPDMMTRRIEAIVVSLVPVDVAPKVKS